MNKYLKKMTSLVLTFTLILISGSSVLASEIDTIYIDYTSQQISTDVLYEMALNNNLINNEITEVTLNKEKIEDDLYVETIFIKQKLSTSRTTKSNDTINVYAATTYVVTKQTTDGGYSTKTTITCTVEEKYFGSNSFIRLKNVSHKWEQLDSQFKVTELYSYYAQTGPGRTDNDTNYYNGYTGNFTTSNPTKNTSYSKNTNFSNWLDGLKGACGSDTRITYYRFNTGNSYTYYINLAV